MRKITISRKNSFIAFLMVAHVILDDQDEPVASLKSGQVVTLMVDDEEHTIALAWVEGYFSHKRVVKSRSLKIKPGNQPVNFGIDMIHFMFAQSQFVLYVIGDTLSKKLIK